MREASGRFYVRGAPVERVQCHQHRKLAGPQNRFGRFGEEEDF